MSTINHNKGIIWFKHIKGSVPLVFIHGFSLDHRMWTPQIQALGNEYGILNYDLRGFGKSSIPKDTYSHHSDLKALLAHLEIEKIHLVGLSLGGEIAIDFTLENPTKVLSLTLLDSSLGGFKSTVNWGVKARSNGIEQAKQTWLNHLVFKSIQNKPDTKGRIEKIIQDYSGWHWLNKDIGQKLKPPAQDQLHKIKVPITTAVGEFDLDYYHEISDYIKSNISHAKQFIIPSAGHISNMENPEYTNKIIQLTINSTD